MPTTEGEETVPISAKHLERQERVSDSPEGSLRTWHSTLFCRENNAKNVKVKSLPLRRKRWNQPFESMTSRKKNTKKSWRKSWLKYVEPFFFLYCFIGSVFLQATQANEIDRVRIGKMVNAYVEKYRLLRQKLSQASSTSNGTRHWKEKCLRDWFVCFSFLYNFLLSFTSVALFFYFFLSLS